MIYTTSELVLDKASFPPPPASAPHPPPRLVQREEKISNELSLWSSGFLSERLASLIADC